MDSVGARPGRRLGAADENMEAAKLTRYISICNSISWVIQFFGIILIVFGVNLMMQAAYHEQICSWGPALSSFPAIFFIRRVYTRMGPWIWHRRIVEHILYNGKDVTTLDAFRVVVLRENALSRIEIIVASCARLKKLLNQAKVCNAQCQNLVQTCILEGTEQIIETSSQLSTSELCQLYHSKKLKQLVSSLDRLIHTLGSIEDFLKACGSQWCRMGLVLSVPFMPPGVKVFTKFDLLLREQGWNLDTISYVLDLTGDLKLNWNEDKCRYVLERKHGTRPAEAAGGKAVEESGTIFYMDRAHLLSQIKNGCIPSKLNFVILWALNFIILWALNFILWTLRPLAAITNATTIEFWRSFSLYSITFVSLSPATLNTLHADRHVLEWVTKLQAVYAVIGASMELWSLAHALVVSLRNFLERLWRRHLLENGNGHYFAEVLKGRLEETTRLGVAMESYLENSQLEEIPALANEFHKSVLRCFQINHMDLKTDEQIGKGGSKSIYRGKWCGLTVAIAKTEETTREAVEREALVMLKVQHPNIVNLFGWAFDDDAPVSTEDWPVCSEEIWPPRGVGYLVMELMQGDLRHVIEQRTKSERGSPFSVAVAVDILLQIAEAMVRMHSLNHMHRDLKAANCLVNLADGKAYTVKLIDFGNSKMFNPELDAKYTANSGTYRWRAPEVWGPPGTVVPYTRSADVYSFGMVCYEVMTGLQPFHEDHGDIREVKKALETSRQPLLRIPASVSCPEGIKKLMSECWLLEPSARPDFKGIVKELWTIKAELELE